MARGYNSAADIIRSRDGQDLNRMWSEFQQTLQIVNTKRTLIGSLFSFVTTDASAEVVQSTGGASFEVASEYGVPQGLRTSPDTLAVGFPIEYYDLGARYTWRFLKDASAQQIEAVHREALTAYNKLVYGLVMNALVNPNPKQPPSLAVPVYGLWNGTDGMTPPPYGGNTFDATHSHYLTSGAAEVDGGDLELLTETVQHHGYGLDERGDQLVILCHPYQGDVIRGFRKGVNGSKFDFIASDDAPAYLTQETIIGQTPPGSFEGLKIFGSYGRAWLAEDRMIPNGYLISLATGGANSSNNPLAIRQDERTQYQGLMQIPGDNNAYPLKESYYSAYTGAGVRLRGGAAVMQVTASPTYTVPVIA